MGVGSLVLGIFAFVNLMDLLRFLILLVAVLTLLGAVFSLLDGSVLWNAAMLIEGRNASFSRDFRGFPDLVIEGDE